MLTKGAIGNLVNRYRAVLKKCNLINTFGSLAVASMLVFGGAGVAGAEILDNHVAAIGNQGYGSLEEAISAADSGTTIKLLKDSSGNGIVINKNITIDFSGNTYDVSGKTVGSANTETLGFQILKSAESVTLTGGTLTSSSDSAKLLVMNYTNLTLDGMILDGTNLQDEAEGKYVLSNNNGNTVIVDSSIIAAPDGVAFDADKQEYYGPVSVTVINSNIIGPIIEDSDPAASVIIKSGSFSDMSALDKLSNEANVYMTATEYTGNIKSHDGEKHTITFGDGETLNDFKMTGSIVRGGIGDVTLIAKSFDITSEENSTAISQTATKLAMKADTINIAAKGDGNAIYVSNQNADAVVDIDFVDSLNISVENGGYAINNQGSDAKLSKLDISGAGNISILGSDRSAIISVGQSSDTDITSTAGNIVISSAINEDNTEANMRKGSVLYDCAGTIDITAENGTITVTEENSGRAIGVAKDGEVTLNAANGVIINGNIETAKVDSDYTYEVPEGTSVLALESDATINGNVNLEGELSVNGTTTLNGDAVVDTLSGEGSVLLTDAESSVTVKNGATASVEASGELNDQLGGDLSKFAEQVKGVDNIVMQEGLIAGEVVKNGDKIVQKVNTVLKDTLEQATAAPLAVNRVLMNDVRKRMGDLRDASGEAGVWMRWDGGKLKGDEGLTNNFNTIQIGGDMLTGIKNVRAGVAASFTHGDIDHNNGDGEMEAYTFAAYGTWMADNGMFADVIGRVGFTNSEINAKGGKADLDNEALSLSAEYGWRLPVCDQFFVEPQVELTYTHVTGADFTIKTAQYDVDSVDSLIGRAGLAAGWKLPNDRGNIYARASMVHEFLGDSKISATNNGGYAAYELDGDDTWLEYGIGANVKLTDKTYIWADVERTEGAEIDEEWRGTVGIRYSF